jgi:uncharacterized protein involved in exopolysaccharide biosynthesis
MSLNQFWATVRAAWLKIVLMVVVATSITFALALQQPKQYTAKARVMLNIDNPEPTQFSALKRGMAAAYIGSEMRLVADAAVMRNVVAKLGWPDNPQVQTAWEAETGGVGDITAWAASRIAQAVSVDQLEDSSILEINYTADSREAAMAIVALIRTAYIEESQKLRADAARRAAAWNRTQSARALATLQAAEAARAAFVTTNAIAVDTPAGGLDYQAQLAALNNVSNHLAATVNAAEAINPTADRLSRKLNALDAEIAVLRLRGEANPVTVALEAERTTVAQELARENAVTPGGDATEDQIGLVRAQRDNEYLASRLHLLDRSPLYDKLAMMDRDIALKTSRYNAASARVANFDAVAAAPSGMVVIGDVIASDDPSYPDIPLLTAVAAGASLALAVAFALLADLVKHQVRGVEDLRVAGAPVLAVIVDDPPRPRWRALAMVSATLAPWRRWRNRKASSPMSFNIDPAALHQPALRR